MRPSPPPRRPARRAARGGGRGLAPAARAGAALLLAGCGARAELVITASSVASLAGARLDAVAFAYSPDWFSVEGELVLTTPDQWDDSGCPGRVPSWKGAAGALAGRIAVLTDPVPAASARCSYEKLTEGAGAAGAVAWLAWVPPPEPLDNTPGAYANVYWDGDSRDLPHPPAADVSQAAFRDVAGALAGGARVRARVSPDPNEWARMWASGAAYLWRVALTVQSAAVLELAGCRLYAFVRADGRIHVSIAHAVLALELAVNLMRMSYVAVDPHWAAGVFPYALGFFLTMQYTAVGAITTALFLVYFANAAVGAGLASLKLTRPFFKWLVIAWAVFIVVLQVATSSAALSVMPIVLLVLSLFTERTVTRALRRHNLPAPLLNRLVSRMRWSLVTSLIAFGAGLFIPWARYEPWRFLVVFGLLTLAQNLTSHIQVDAFKPIGQPVPRGPLRILYGAVGLCVRRGCSRNGRLCCLFGSADVAPEPNAEPQRGGAHDDVLAAVMRRVSNEATTSALSPHLMLGVSPRFLREFCAAEGIDDSAVTYEVGELIRRRTQAENVSLAERSVGLRTANGRPAVARPTLFVSHAQACSFTKLLDAVDSYLELHGMDAAATYLWVDLYCIRQNSVGEDVRFIGEVERQIGRVVVVLDPWHAPVCLTRVWCLYEIVHTQLVEETIFHLTMAPDERRAFVRALQTNRRRVEQVLSTFDARTAEATNETDKRMIFELIRESFATPDGRGDPFELFNNTVQKAVKQALAAFSWQV